MQGSVTDSTEHFEKLLRRGANGREQLDYGRRHERHIVCIEVMMGAEELMEENNLVTTEDIEENNLVTTEDIEDTLYGQRTRWACGLIKAA